MRDLGLSRSLTLLLALCPLWAPTASAEGASSLDAVLDEIVVRERDLAEALGRYTPLVETYLQTVEPDAVLGTSPVADSYFLGRLELGEYRPSPPAEPGRRSSSGRKTLNLFDDFHSATFKPERFARMLLLDRGSFDREHYVFDFVRAEFLGEIRTLVFDVAPRPGKVLSRLHTARFTGRIWVEDQEHTIVRYNGVYAAPMSVNFHFDSWRLNLAPGLWLPAYVYTEEPERASKQRRLMHKGQIRIWGYEIERPSVEDEFAKVLIDAPQTDDRSDRPGQISPVESVRAWEGEAEENVLRRLQRAGLLAPEGEVDEVLETVVSNLEITNSLDIQPPVRCRVLLTTPLESFTIGHTIVLSRGLIDVLPDEASLAMVLAHELGHILSGHRLETRYAFGDQVAVGDEQALERFLFQRNPLEETQADDRAVALLESSPYKTDLASAGLFLKALGASAKELPALIRPHFGNRLAARSPSQRMPQLLEAAPELDPASLTQIGALPLGGRVKLDPWNAHVELMKDNRVALVSAREKMSFQVTPLMPYLARHTAGRQPLAKSRGTGRAETVVVTRKEQ